MPDSSYDNKCLTQGSLVMSPGLEAKTCDGLLTRLTQLREEMGWMAQGKYRPGSYLWDRYVAMRMYEGDFSHRSVSNTIFSTSNLTLNMPKDFIDTHYMRAAQDLLGGDNFFEIMPEGPEDQDPAVKLWEKYLQRRAKDTGMQNQLKAACKGAFQRGDTIWKATDKTVTQYDTKQVRVVMSQGEVAKDSRGVIITELDPWGPVPDNPALQMLLRDPKVTLAAEANPLAMLSAITTPVLVPLDPKRGCELALPYWADVIFQVTDPDIRQSDFFAHVFMKAPDDLADSLDPSLRTPAFEKYYERCLQGGASNPLSDEATAVLMRGERDTKADEANSAFAPRLYAEVWSRSEVTEEGTPASKRRREDISMLIDMELKQPIAYDYRYKLIPWAKNRRNPFGMTRISPVEKRATGIGYYKELEDSALYVDKNHNRVEIAISTSGNQVFRDRSGVEEWKQGRPLKYRSTDVLTLVPGKEATEVLAVVTVPCLTKELVEAKDQELSRMQAMKGIITPADAGNSGLPAADTLGGMQILEKTSDVQLKQRESELMGNVNEGLMGAIGDFAEIEGYCFDPLFAEKIFAPLADAQIQGAQDQAQAAAQGQPVQPIDPAMRPADNVAILEEWIAKNRNNLRNRVSVVLNPKNSSQIVSEASQRTDIIERWFALGLQFGPDAQRAAKADFAAQLAQLGSPNPESTLVIGTQPPQPPNGQPAAQPGPSAGGAGPAQNSPVPPPTS